MAQCNFVDNVLHPDPTPLQDEVVVNFELIAGMAASPDYAAKYPGSSEISIGADSKTTKHSFTRPALSAIRLLWQTR
jgi:hypothetical protein